MNISEQVKELIKNLRWYGSYADGEINRIMHQAADTIESLSAKLSAENMERSADGNGWIYCGDGKNLPKEDGLYWAVVTLPKPVECGYDLFETEQWYDNYTLEELCEWEKNAPRHTGLIKFKNGDWEPQTKRRFTKILAWQPIIEPEPYHEPQ